MEKFIGDFVEIHGFKYLKIGNSDCVSIIYDLYYHGINRIENLEISDSTIDLYYGVYFKIKQDYDQMKKYYLMAIEKGNEYAMNNLGFHYEHIEKDYELMKKYYLMAIEKGYKNAMYNLGFYYEEIKDYDQMKKYYLMAIEKGHCIAIFDLEKWYQKNKDTVGLLQLYIKTNNTKKVLKILINYSIQNTMNEEINRILLEYLNSIDESELPVIFKICKQLLNKQVDLLDVHFKYAVNGLGFNEAKRDFYQQISLFNNM